MTDAEYRRAYDRLFVASMKANTAEECDAIDRKLAALNARREKATKKGTA